MADDLYRYAGAFNITAEAQAARRHELARWAAGDPFATAPATGTPLTEPLTRLGAHLNLTRSLADKRL